MTEATVIDVARVLTDNVRKYLDAVLPRMVALAVKEAVQQVKGEPGLPGRDGQDADPAVIERMVGEAVARIPLPLDGSPGADGKDADPEVIRAEVAKAVAALPIPKDGIDGRDGQDGIGRDGKDADPEVIRAEVAKAVAALPVPKDGRDGADGKDVDLLVVKALVAGEVAHAIAAMPPPKDGRDGKDGITEEKMESTTLKAVAAVMGEVRLDGRKFMLGDRLIKTLPIPIYMGVYEPGTSYEQGDMVSFGGNVWHCEEPTSEKPESTRAWKLAVKRGRDGREPARMAEKGIVPVKR